MTWVCLPFQFVGYICGNESGTFTNVCKTIFRLLNMGKYYMDWTALRNLVLIDSNTFCGNQFPPPPPSSIPIDRRLLSLYAAKHDQTSTIIYIWTILKSDQQIPNSEFHISVYGLLIIRRPINTWCNTVVIMPILLHMLDTPWKLICIQSNITTCSQLTHNSLFLVDMSLVDMLKEHFKYMVNEGNNKQNKVWLPLLVN